MGFDDEVGFDMKLGQLRSFVAVAETGGLAAAARRVGRTPSAVSMSLKQLEETLGGSLFEGERKGRLTPLGEHCLLVARRMVEDHEAGQEEMLRFAAGGDGEIRIAAVPSAACGVIADALARHSGAAAKDGIGVRLELRDGDSNAVAAAVAGGVADIGVAQRPAEGLGLSFEPLISEAYSILFPPGHPRAEDQTPVRWAELEGEDVVTSPLMEALIPPQHRVALRHARARALTLLSVGAAVRAGLGLSAAPLLAAGRILSDLPSVPLAEDTSRRSLYLISRAEGTLSPAAEAFVGHLRDAAGPPPVIPA